MTIRSGVYRLRNLKSGTYLDNSAKNREVIHGWDSRPGSGNQEWEVRQQGDESYTLRNVSSRRYVHVSNGNDGTRVKAGATESEATLWDIRAAGDNAYRICLNGSRGVIDLDNGNDENGTTINIWAQTQARQQKWEFERVRDLEGGHSEDRRDVPGQQPVPQPGGGGGGAGQYRGAVNPGRYWVRNAHSGTALDLSGSDRNDGTAIIGYQVTRGNNQQWELEPGVQGYRIRNIATGTYLSLRGGERPQEGALLTGNSNASFEWDVSGDQNGYTFILANSNLALDLAEGNSQNGAKICLWTSSGANNQRWLLERA